MDSLIAAAGRALVVGDALGAFKRVGLRDDPPALALRSIAMAQLGEHPRARELLRRAARGFGAHEELARARCVVAEAEVALAMRDLRGSPRTSAAALDRPAARRVHAGRDQPLRLDEVEALLASGALVVDACRRGLRAGATWRPLARRPVLFALAHALAEAWPGDVDRQALIARAFGARRPDESHRARLRVEIGRLRALVAPVARIEASARGFALTPRGERAVVVLAPPIDGDQASLLALLADGAAWSTSAPAPAP